MVHSQLNYMMKLVNQIREVGREYGTTTGRPRRVGWFDSVVVRHARRVSGITDLSLNSIDVLTGLETVKICVAYNYNVEKSLKNILQLKCYCRM